MQVRHDSARKRALQNAAQLGNPLVGAVAPLALRPAEGREREVDRDGTSVVELLGAERRLGRTVDGAENCGVAGGEERGAAARGVGGEREREVAKIIPASAVEA